jgi:ElaB/YqjD/DUF883 family membrane-anchored ribosome-binding protein
MAKAATASSKMPGDVRDDIDTLKADLARARADIADLVSDLVSAGKAEGTEARAKIEAAIHERLDRLGEGISAAQRAGRRKVEDLQDRIEDRPLTSVAVAFGVGLLLGNVFGRR